MYCCNPSIFRTFSRKIGAAVLGRIIKTPRVGRSYNILFSIMQRPCWWIIRFEGFLLPPTRMSTKMKGIWLTDNRGITWDFSDTCVYRKKSFESFTVWRAKGYHKELSVFVFRKLSNICKEMDITTFNDRRFQKQIEKTMPGIRFLIL